MFETSEEVSRPRSLCSSSSRNITALPAIFRRGSKTPYEEPPWDRLSPRAKQQQPSGLSRKLVECVKVELGTKGGAADQGVVVNEGLLKDARGWRNVGPEGVGLDSKALHEVNHQLVTEDEEQQSDHAALEDTDAIPTWGSAPTRGADESN